MYTLFIANKNYSSWSLRPWVLLRELNIEFTERLIPFAEGSSWSIFREFSPNGTVPCLHDNDAIVWDSLGIIEYLAERHDGVWPQDAAARTWARCATAEMHSGFSALRNECTMTCGQRIALHTISTALQRDIDRIDELWTEGLQRFGGDFLTGDSFTAVDAFYAPVAFRIQTFALQVSQPAQDYAQRLLSLASMQDWNTAGLAETWREPGHEQEAAQAGRIISDFRQNE